MSLNPLTKLDQAYALLKTEVEASDFFAKVKPLYDQEKANPNRWNPRMFKFTVTKRFLDGIAPSQQNPTHVTERFSMKDLRMAANFITYKLVETGDEVSFTLSRESTVMTFVVKEFNSKANMRTKQEMVQERQLLNNYVEFPPKGFNR